MYKNSPRILVVDDEEKIVEVVKSYLEREGYTVFYAYTGEDALQLFDKINPSLAVLDLMLPDILGEDICRIIRKKSRIPIIMLTAKTKESDMLNGIEIGADDYITKPFSPRQLAARVMALLRRVSNEPVPLSNVMSYNKGELVINDSAHDVKVRGDSIKLTPMEYKLLVTMIKYPNKVFTRDELVFIALGGEFDGFDRTIDSHIKNLRQKIETDPRNPEYILTIHGVGYKFDGI